MKKFVNTQTATGLRSAATIMRLGNNIAVVKRLVKSLLLDSVIGIKCKWSEMGEES